MKLPSSAIVDAFDHLSLQGVDITSMSANRGLICVGDADGFVHLANRSLDPCKFQAHELFVSHVVMVRGHLLRCGFSALHYFLLFLWLYSTMLYY